jgi:mechanosensitive ion channel-like protein
MFVADIDLGASVQRALDDIGAFLPQLLAALAILIVGYIVAKVLGRLVARVLNRVGFDRVLHGSPGGSTIERVLSRPSDLLGTFTFWAVFLAAIGIAVDVLGIAALSNAVAAVWAYLPNVLAAVLIFIVAGAIAAAISTLARRTMGDTALGRIVGTAAPILVMTIATFMILDQLKIAPEIVTITYAGLVGAIALGSALAFGLGGRDVAHRMLEQAYEKGERTAAEYRANGRKRPTRVGEDTYAVSEEPPATSGEPPRTSPAPRSSSNPGP